MKGFENGGIKDDDVNAKPISPLLQMSDFLQNRKSSTISNDLQKKDNIIPPSEVKIVHKIQDNNLREDDCCLNDIEKENKFKEKVNENRASNGPAASINNHISDTDKAINSLSYEQHVKD